MIIKEKRYIKKCDCGTEIIYTRRDCYHNTTWDIYSLYCPSCSHEYSYRRGTHHDLFDKEYEEDSVDKDEEIERLNNIINKKEQFLGDNIKRLEREVVKRDNIINELNTAYCKVITKCEEMIDSRFYMNDIAIKKYSDEIKDICKYYVGEAKELKGDDKSDKS